MKIQSVRFSACLIVAAMAGFVRGEEPALRLSCRVTDNAGVPLAGVTARLRKLGDGRAAPESLLTAVENVFGGAEEPVELAATGEDGLVRTGELTPGRIYVMEFARPGYSPVASQRSHALDAGETRLPDARLRRLRTVQGQITDRDGRPLADVAVFQSGNGAPPTLTHTAKSGRFQLPDVPEGPSLIFARHDGFWFRGALAPADDEPLGMALAPRDQPNVEQYNMGLTSPPDVVLPGEHGPQNLAGLVAEVRRAAQTDDRFAVLQPFGALAAIDIDRADQLLDEMDLADALRNQMRSQVVTSMAARDFEAAKALLQALDDPEWRIATVYTVLYRRTELRQQEKRQLLAMALTDVRSENDVYQRAQHLAQLYPLLMKAGEAETARKLLALSLQDLQQADGALQQRNVYGSLAEAIAPYEPDQALELLEKADPMFGAWVAWGIAAQKPEKAAELIRKYKFQASGGSRLTQLHCLPRVCYRLAQTNLDLAKDVANLSAGVAGSYPPYAPPESARESAASDVAPILLKAALYGFMARAVGKKHPEQAKQLLREAVEMLLPLRTGVRNTAGGFIYTPAMVLGSMVRTAGDIDPGLAAEICWQALSLRFSPLLEDTFDALSLDTNHTELAQVAGPLDPQLAVALLQPLAERATARAADGRFQAAWMLYAYHMLDPQQGVKWLETLCDKPAAEGQLSPREMLLNVWLAMADQNAELHRRPIAQQAELWLHSTLWLSGVAEDE